MPQRSSTLIISKDEASFEALRICLSDPGLTLSANSAEQGQKILEAREAPIMLIELNCTGNFEALLSSALGYDSDAQVMVLASSSEQALASRLLKAGACDILPRPCDPEILRAASDRGPGRWLAAIEVLLCLLLFAACALHVRMRLRKAAS